MQVFLDFYSAHINGITTQEMSSVRWYENLGDDPLRLFCNALSVLMAVICILFPEFSWCRIFMYSRKTESVQIN